MKDNRFIELLNLYIDRQISVAETAELEAEIQQNPARQAVYRQYCQIHSATKLVYDSFRANATVQPVHPTDRPGVVELFETQRRRNHQAFYAAAGLAAAACLALVFIRHNSTPTAGELMVATKSEVRPVAARAAAVEVAATPVKAIAPVTGTTNLRTNVATTPDYSAMLAALREQDEELALASRHLQSSHIQSLFDDGLFNANQPLPAQNTKVFRLQQAETTVFQFQR